MNRTVLSKEAPASTRWTGPTIRDIRAARIARLRELVASGRYKVDLFALADRLLDSGILRDVN